MTALRPGRNPMTSFIGAASACCYARDFEALDIVFSKMPEAAAVRLGKMVSDRLFAHAARTGDWQTWAEALHHLPRPGQREAGAAFCAHLDAWSAPRPARPADDAARRLRRLACELVRAHVPGRQLLHRLDEANGTLSDPVSAEAIGRIATWAARTAKKEPARAR